LRTILTGFLTEKQGRPDAGAAHLFDILADLAILRDSELTGFCHHGTNLFRNPTALES
jgi:hypothetical protein